MSEPVIYVAKIMAQSADAAANSIHENLQQAVQGQQKSHAAKVRKVVIEGWALSAAIKLGSLEKNVKAFLISLWCVQSSPFFVGKTKLHNLLPS